jgi:hypothetical protein
MTGRIALHCGIMTLDTDDGFWFMLSSRMNVSLMSGLGRLIRENIKRAETELGAIVHLAQEAAHE